MVGSECKGDGGGSGGKEQRDEWNKPPVGSRRFESFQIWEQGLVGGAKLHGRENFRHWSAALSELERNFGNEPIPSSSGVF